jgi:hypothetical protein
VPEASPFPPDPDYPVDAQFDLVVRGTSINRAARDGERLRCVDLRKVQVDLYDGALVIFERMQGHLIETTAKRYRRRGPVIELWPDSDDPKWHEPLRIDTRTQTEERGRIIALVLYSYNPLFTRRR